jgi:hypothetical protein
MNQAPVAAAVYYEDAAVVREYSLETARAIQVRSTFMYSFFLLFFFSFFP